MHKIYKFYKSADFRHWSPGNQAIAFLSEFAQLDSNGSGKPDWTDLSLPQPARTGTNTTDLTDFGGGVRWRIDDELAELVRLIEYRHGVLDEALQQRDTLIGYFQGILPFSYLSHPYTFRLCHLALAVAQFLAFHFKMKFQRPRPSQLHPGIFPPIDVPQHAAYPSAHATEAWLVASCLDEVMLDAAGNKILEFTHPGGETRNALHDMATRISRNREVLGVHYPSDSEAGKRLARAALPIVKACATVGSLADNGLLKKARAEWTGVSNAAM
ncbi:phosphatase PAP2 family protein [Ruegeria marina]|uniref:phosphatase PAP2 family protein n=1 Tax=Ruegeria marina TaxID=639004 RepID=UPI0015A202FB|nr:hypothetical protein [Ruegeria marina]